MKAARAKQVLEQIGAPMPRWLIGTESDVDRESRKATLRELQAVTRSLLRDHHILRLAHRHPGSWTSQLAEHADISKGETHRALNRLRKDGLAHFTNDKLNGRKIRRIWPGPTRTHPPLKPLLEPNNGGKKTGVGITSGVNNKLRSKMDERAQGGPEHHKQPMRQRQTPIRTVFHRLFTKSGGGKS